MKAVNEIVFYNNYLLVIDYTNEIDDKCHYLVMDGEGNSIKKADREMLETKDLYIRKILAHLPVKNAPYLQNVDVLPPLV